MNVKVEGDLIFFFWVLRGGGIFCFLIHSQCVPNVFLICSHQVPNLFLKMFPISIHFIIPYCLAMLQLMCIHIVKGVRKGSMKQSMLLFWGGEAYLGFYIEECPMFQKNW